MSAKTGRPSRPTPSSAESGPDQYVRYEYTDADDIAYPFIAILGEKIIEYTDDENGPYAKLFNKCDPS